MLTIQDQEVEEHIRKDAAYELHRRQSHIVRSAVEGHGKFDITSVLDDNSGLLVLDWFMKWLPMRSNKMKKFPFN